MFTAVGTGWILPIFSTYLDLSYLVRSMMPDFDFGCVALWRLWLNTSRLPTSTNGHDELHCSNITELLPCLPLLSNHQAIIQCRVPARSVDGLRSGSKMNWHRQALGETALSSLSCTAHRQNCRLRAIGASRTRHIAESLNGSLGFDKALNRSQC